ncbi:MAG TPA: 2Fe-2S iron-sulfur cluster-binding protein [Thermoguttaceae bacterium]|nr:2Fe-2S iron-sulfur cluster-binding protein [Thermoguttaceae bacterium]
MISPNMVRLTIDGKTVEVPEGSTVLEAAQKLGIEIPTLCHHKALMPYGACRLCLVELVFSWGSQIQASCVYPAQEGLEVKTDTERVRRTRGVMMELLLARCPGVESIRQMAKQMGVEDTRFPKKDEDCILCGLCVRVCAERMGVGAINFANRGTKKKIAPAYDRQSPLCMACGACEVVCPTHCVDLSTVSLRPARPIPSEFDEGLMGRPSIYMPFAQAVPHKPVIDKETCLRLKTGECGACEAVCDAGAIMYDQVDTIEEIEVGTIIVATGFDLFDATRIARYGYGRLKNVLNALEFERISHASGPTGGEILTAEGKVPKSVAIIHCVGSRDENYHEYCSRVCCMYSLKFAHLVLEKTGAEVYNFYIDMRTPGKGYEEFYKRLMHEGVHFIRGKCAEVTDVAESPEEEGKLVVVGEDTLLGVTRRVPVDMVILSGALQPRADVDEVARTFSLSCAQGDFFLEKHPKLAPVEAASDGIYLAGACQGPKDIPDSVAQGAAAAACALALMDKGSVTLEPITSWIDPDRCSGCQTCVASCPYAAIEFDEENKVSVVVEELCKGCGTCVATCPAGVARQKGFADAQIYSELEGLLAQ